MIVAMYFYTGVFYGRDEPYSGGFWTSLCGLCNVDLRLDLCMDLDFDLHPSLVDMDTSIRRLTLAAMGGSVMHGDQPLRSSLPLIIDQSA